MFSCKAGLVKAKWEQLPDWCREKYGAAGEQQSAKDLEEGLVSAKLAAQNVEHVVAVATHPQRVASGRREPHRRPGREQLGACLPSGASEAPVWILGCLQEGHLARERGGWRGGPKRRGFACGGRAAVVGPRARRRAAGEEQCRGDREDEHAGARAQRPAPASSAARRGPVRRSRVIGRVLPYHVHARARAYEQAGESKSVSFKPSVSRGDASAGQMATAIRAAMLFPPAGK